MRLPICCTPNSEISCTVLTVFLSCTDGPRSAGWREHPDQRRRFPFDAREDERGYRRPRSGSGSLEDERDSLPEWCLEDADEEAGTFDSSGAFLSLKVKGDLSLKRINEISIYVKLSVGVT